MEEISVSIDLKSGLTLRGTKTLPKGKEVGAAVLVHGFMVDRHDAGFDSLALELATKGVVVYRFDFSGCGESDGDIFEISIDTRNQELKEVISFAETDSGYSADQMVLVGQSLGGASTLSLKDKFAAKVLTCVPDDYFSSIEDIFEDFNPEGISTRVRSTGKRVSVGPQFWKSLEENKPQDQVVKQSVPLLFVYGEEDNVTTIEQTGRLYELAPEPKDHFVMSGMEHGWEPKKSEMADRVSSWIELKLKERERKRDK